MKPKMETRHWFWFYSLTILKRRTRSSKLTPHLDSNHNVILHETVSMQSCLKFLQQHEPTRIGNPQMVYVSLHKQEVSVIKVLGHTGNIICMLVDLQIRISWSSSESYNLLYLLLWLYFVFKMSMISIIIKYNCDLKMSVYYKSFEVSNELPSSLHDANT